MVRVLHISHDRLYEPLRGGGGVARHIHGLCQEMAALGAEARVAAARTDVEGAAYECVDASGLSLRSHIAWADVVHLHGPRLPRMAVAAITARLMSKPFVFTPHAYYDRQPPSGGIGWLAWKAKQVFKKSLYDQTVERFMITRSAATILLNDSWRDFVRNEMRLPATRCVVLPNCVRAADLPTVPRGEKDVLTGNPSVLSVGRLDEVKRLEDMIAALDLPEMSEAVFHVVGKGPDLERLQEVAVRLGVTERVIFHGFVDDEGVARMSAVCDVFVLPSRQEGMPTVLIEMLLRGVPVVCSDIPGNRAIIEPAGVEGVYPLGDIPALARAIGNLAASTVSKDTQARVADTLTWEKRASDFLALYEKAVAGD